MRILLIFICLSIGYRENPDKQYINQVWSHKVKDCTIDINFEKGTFKIDTINFIEGYAFYLKSLSDSSCFRINNITYWAKFDCCTEDSIYKETNEVIEKGVISREGTINKTNLYWREIRYEGIDIVYYNCSKEKLKTYNKIMDSIYIRLVRNEK